MIKKGFQFQAEESDIKIDVSPCDKCGGEMLVVCAIVERDSIVSYLSSLGIDADPPASAPSKIRQEKI